MAYDATQARPEGPTPDHNYSVTVMVDGAPKQQHLPAQMTVLEAIRKCLAPRDKPKAEDFIMVDRDVGTAPLEHHSTLEKAGVRDGHTLSITKRDGGGG